MAKKLLNSISAVYNSLYDTSIEVFRVSSKKDDDLDSRFANDLERKNFFKVVNELSENGNTSPKEVTIGNEKTSIIVD